MNLINASQSEYYEKVHFSFLAKTVGKEKQDECLKLARSFLADNASSVCGSEEKRRRSGCQLPNRSIKLGHSVSVYINLSKLRST